MSLADAVVPQPWSAWTAIFCIAVIVLGGIASLIVGLTEDEADTKNDVWEGWE